MKLAIEPKLALSSYHMQLLTLIEYWAHVSAYPNTKDSERRRNQPEPFNPFKDRGGRKEETVAVTREQLARYFKH